MKVGKEIKTALTAIVDEVLCVCDPHLANI